MLPNDFYRLCDKELKSLPSCEVVHTFKSASIALLDLWQGHPEYHDRVPASAATLRFLGGARSYVARGLPREPHLIVGVEYELDLLPETFDQEEALRNAREVGIIVYERSPVPPKRATYEGEFAQVWFDVRAEQVSYVGKNHFADLPGVHRLKGQRLEDGVRNFIELVRGVK